VSTCSLGFLSVEVKPGIVGSTGSVLDKGRLDPVRSSRSNCSVNVPNW